MLKNWFYKDSHVVVQAGPHMEAQHRVTMSTVITGNELDEHYLDKSRNTHCEKIGTYSAISLKNITNPASVVFWLVFNQQMGSVDVASMIECVVKGVKPGIYFGVNNPMVGCPYISIWSDDGKFVYKKQLRENDEFIFSDTHGHNIRVRRNSDSDYKEWTITIDP